MNLCVLVSVSMDYVITITRLKTIFEKKKNILTLMTHSVIKIHFLAGTGSIYYKFETARHHYACSTDESIL